MDREMELRGLDITQFLTNIQVTTERCWCCLHGGEVIRQADAKLITNQKPVRIMKDSYGYRVAIDYIDEYELPRAVSSLDAERIIRNAL